MSNNLLIEVKDEDLLELLEGYSIQQVKTISDKLNRRYNLSYVGNKVVVYAYYTTTGDKNEKHKLAVGMIKLGSYLFTWTVDIFTPKFVRVSNERLLAIPGDKKRLQQSIKNYCIWTAGHFGSSLEADVPDRIVSLFSKDKD